MNPIFPTSHSLPGRVLALILSGQKLTHRDFQNHASTYRLSAYIESLRKKGWPVADEWQRAPTNDPTGRMARFKQYFLESDELQELQQEHGAKITQFITAVKKFESAPVSAKNEGTK